MWNLMKKDIEALICAVSMILVFGPILIVSFLIELYDPKGFWGK
jgi:hypothetical protein